MIRLFAGREVVDRQRNNSAQAGQTCGAVVLALIFLLLFVSRQKVRRGKELLQLGNILFRTFPKEDIRKTLNINTMKEFFENINERFRSPLFASFVISWLCINWRISFAVLFYKNREVYKYHDQSLIEYVASQGDTYTLLFYPLLLAIVYVGGYPFVYEGMRALKAFSKKIGSGWERKANPNGWIPVSRYYKILDENEESTKKLQEQIAKEKEIENENARHKSEIEQLNLNLSKIMQDSQESESKLKEKINSLTNEVKYFSGNQDSKTINGRWKREETRQEGTTETYFVTIVEGRMYTENGGHMDVLIRFFQYFREEEQIFFVRYERKGFPTWPRVNILKLNADKTILEGSEYGGEPTGLKVRMERI